VSQHPYITAFIIILINPVPLATWYPYLLRLPMTARGIVNRSRCIIDRCRSIISWSIAAITPVGNAIAIIRISSQIYSNCPAVITVATIITTVTTIVTATMTVVPPMASIVSAASVPAATMTVVTPMATRVSAASMAPASRIDSSR